MKPTTTTCEFANNVFYEYWTATGGGEEFTSNIRAHSSAIGGFLELTCVEEGDDPVCRTSKGAEVEIPRQALADYTRANAEAYAASHTVTK